MLSEVQQQSLDIDWFFTNNNEIAFVASGGGKIPQSVAQSVGNSKLLLDFFRNLPVISDIVINSDLDKIVSYVDETYLTDFIFFSKRGLLSFDKTILNNFLNTHYHLVAKPVTCLQFDQLPLEIKNVLFNTVYEGNIEPNIDCALIS